MLRQIIFFRVSLVPKRCSGIFNVSNAWTNMWNKMMEGKKMGVERHSSKKGFKRMSMPAEWRDFSRFWILLPVHFLRFQAGLGRFKACLSSF